MRKNVAKMALKAITYMHSVEKTHRQSEVTMGFCREWDKVLT